MAVRRRSPIASGTTTGTVLFRVVEEDAPFVAELLELRQRARTAGSDANPQPSKRGLTAAQEAAARARGFQSRQSLHVSGTMVGRGAGLVLVDGKEIQLQGREFRLFVRLVVGLLESGDGYVDQGSMTRGDGLIGEGYCKPSTMFQISTDMRARLQGALDVRPAQFLERSVGRLRLSVPPELVTWDRALEHYPDELVRQCAGRLPSRDRTPLTVKGRNALRRKRA